MFDRKKNRLAVFDYSNAGCYFITLCTNSGLSLFGHLKNKSIELTDIGLIVKTNLERIPSIHPDIYLDEFIIMPDHLHAIIIINNIDSVGDANLASPLSPSSNLATPIAPSSDLASHKPDSPNIVFPEPFSQNSASFETNSLNDRTKMELCKVLQQYKRACSYEIKQRKLFMGNIWQRSFYDRVLRNKSELFLTRKYIRNNPAKWQKRTTL